jgi:hypothetical protein
MKRSEVPSRESIILLLFFFIWGNQTELDITSARIREGCGVKRIWGSRGSTNEMEEGNLVSHMAWEEERRG